MISQHNLYYIVTVIHQCSIKKHLFEVFIKSLNLQIIKKKFEPANYDKLTQIDIKLKHIVY